MALEHESNTPIANAVRKAGSQSAFGRLIGKRQSTVAGWLKAGQVSAEHVLSVEKATGISRHELRPDLYPRETPSTLAPRGNQHVDRPDPATRHHFGAGLEQAR